MTFFKSGASMRRNESSMYGIPYIYPGLEQNHERKYTRARVPNARVYNINTFICSFNKYPQCFHTLPRHLE